VEDSYNDMSMSASSKLTRPMSIGSRSEPRSRRCLMGMKKCRTSNVSTRSPEKFPLDGVEAWWSDDRGIVRRISEARASN
jgi:hypothetical protein